MIRAWSVVVVCGSLVSCGKCPEPAGWGYRELYPVARSVDNGLGPAQRAEVYHLAEGSEVYPAVFFDALEDRTSGLPFKDNLERFGLIPDPDHDLPIGVTRAPGELGLDMIGINCAACHVGQIHYQGTALRIDGAPNQFDIEGFYGELIASSIATLEDADRLARFAGKILLRTAGPADPDGPSPSAKRPAFRSERDVEERLNVFIGRLQAFSNLASDRPQGTPGRFGRTDAFGIARNILFPSEPRPPTAPIAYPALWGFGDVEWLHWNANTNSVMERNIGQALGLGAVYNPSTLDSSVEPRNLYKLEAAFLQVRAPTWPADVFGPLDAGKVARGAELYASGCASCHDGPHMTSASGKLLFPEIALEDIGTDPSHARNFDQPVAGVPFVDKLAELLDRIKQRAYQRFPAAETMTWESGRSPRAWRSALVYPARPLAGIWASAPYLHNGSVPTLHDLLLPPAERPARFGIGYREYDPVKVGYRTDRRDANPLAHELDTAEPGNGNGGHLYGTDLGADDRAALLEYLKSL